MRTTATADPSTAAPWTSNRRCRYGHAERQTVSIKRSYNAIRFDTYRYGVVVNYLVGVFRATQIAIFGGVKYIVYTKKLRISSSHLPGYSQTADR
jgi:hypothetical protein